MSQDLNLGTIKLLTCCWTQLKAEQQTSWINDCDMDTKGLYSIFPPHHGDQNICILYLERNEFILRTSFLHLYNGQNQFQLTQPTSLIYMKDLNENSSYGFTMYKPCLSSVSFRVKIAAWICIFWISIAPLLLLTKIIKIYVCVCACVWWWWCNSFLKT